MTPVTALSLLRRARLLTSRLIDSRLIDEQHGQGLMEYALILTLVAIVAIVALSLFGAKVTSVLVTVSRSI